ncbi:MAG: hypothetical protein LBC64_05970 [Fibromonadaceae bacterium]|nr:hypothetical protein [Fibromonadaceae bacterium]
MIRVLMVIALCSFACSIEDPSVAGFDLQRIRLNGDTPFNAYFREPEPYTHADKQADLFYAMSNGDTMKISICEFESAMHTRAFFYNTDSIIERAEILSENERKRFLKRGRRLFIFSYTLPISENSSTLDSIVQFTRKFPAKDTSASMDFRSFSLKNSRADKDVSVQRDYFLGVKAPFIMLARRYRDADFTWVCARSSAPVSEGAWKDYKDKWQNNFYGQDSTALISRLSNGIVVAVYGDLDKGRMRKIFNEFKVLVN